MNNAVKIGIYLVLAIAALWFGTRFYSEFKQRTDLSNAVLPGDPTEPAQPTNAPPAVAETNAADVATNPVAQTTDTNALANSETNAATNTSQQVTNPPAQAGTPPTITAGAATQSAGKVRKGSWMKNLGAFLGVLVLLGLMVAYDATQFFGNRSVDFLFNEDLKGVHNPEYEEAEGLWANGKPLDAIQAMREYLKKNPREQYVAIRIAEIYEKDLRNYLAAALEYEQVLEHKLPRERWGWAAIHLCNLYSKLDKTDQCVALLRRIESEYNETAAARKARKRLAMFESAGDATSLGLDTPDDPNAPAEVEEPAPKARVRVVAKKKEEEPTSNLPPGFRPKK